MKKLTIAAGLMVLALASAYGVAAEKKAARPRRVAVLPLKNLRPKTDTDWIGAGAAETLTTKLAALPQLILIERAQLSKVIDEHDLQTADFTDPETAAKLGRLVGAERVLIGSYAVEGGNILFNCRVVDVETAVVLNTASLRAGKERLLDAFFQLAEAVIQSFDKKVVVVDRRPKVTEAPPAERVVLTEDQRQMLRKWGTTSPEAYEALAHGVDATDPNDKVRWFTRAIELDGRYSWAYNNRGIAYGKKGDHNRAIRDFDKAIEHHPKYAAAYSNRGIAYGAKGDYDRAIKDYDKAIELNPKDAKAYNNRGNVYRKKGDHNRAIRDYGKAIELNPKYAAAYNNRGGAYHMKGDYDRAIRYYGKAIELNPKLAEPYKNRAMAHYFERQYGKAWADVKKCQKLGGKVPPKFLEDLRKASGRNE